MKFLLSLSLIPLLLLTNVSAAETLPLPTYKEGNPAASYHKYENPTSEDKHPLLAITADENDNADSDDLIIIQNRANDLCVSLGHQRAGRMLEEDIKYGFQGKAYLEGEIVEVRDQLDAWSLLTLGLVPILHTNGIFKILRCVG